MKLNYQYIGSEIVVVHSGGLKMSDSRIDRRSFLRNSAALGLGASAFIAGCSTDNPAELSQLDAMKPSGRRDKPNFIILFADDMGYGDWNRGGHPTIRTPNMNRMADQGVQFTQFYSGAPSCSPSRSCLLTGRNFIRTGMLKVLFPNDPIGMSKDEITIADALKPLGYNTACYGKWHLGCQPGYMPLDQGFDEYFGILYSNDMKNADLYEGYENVEAPADQNTLTRRYTERALSFIDKNKENPFFIYLPYAMPHVPLHRSEKFENVSRRGLYGDVIEELDWSVGQINDKLDELGLAENTLVLFYQRQRSLVDTGHGRRRQGTSPRSQRRYFRGRDARAFYCSLERGDSRGACQHERWVGGRLFPDYSSSGRRNYACRPAL